MMIDKTKSFDCAYCYSYCQPQFWNVRMCSVPIFYYGHLLTITMIRDSFKQKLKLQTINIKIKMVLKLLTHQAQLQLELCL
ncbi:hypothetical protein EB796_007401 [Bugula neritina]|uniref:Uncharacterized protein n=1 Tax=Bugula neritina TaxID=10212 RepID=A0A7J7K6N9_BUGNE|nr:hypothetical protein EB796_007401 [Bugula neritina]